jgi:hypothetical protein
MFRLGIEATCISRPYPWLPVQPAPTPLAGWRPAELVRGGMPVLPRYPLKAAREDLALTAMLGQPLILYGHHGELANGLDVLAQAAADIDSLGDVRWGPLSSIARASFATRSVEGLLLVRMHARRVIVDVPAGVRAVRVLVEEPLGGAAGLGLAHAGGCTTLELDGGLAASEPLAVAAPTRLELNLLADRPLDPERVPSPRLRLWPLLRRAIVEGRDRAQPLFHRDAVT